MLMRPGGELGARAAAVADASDTILSAAAVSKAFAAIPVLKNIDLDIKRGEFVALVGPSGSGKSTLLRIIGGFEAADGGRILIGGVDVTGETPARRPTGMVFQRLALFPHMSVRANIGYPLKLKGLPAHAIEGRVGELMALMHLPEHYARRLPQQLSGGEQQRVALARGRARWPTILLVGEPLGAHDAKLKKNLQAEIRDLHRKVGVTFLHVTHDLEEAMVLADRICVMHGGTILQYATPGDIYYRPANAFVASFIGETNLIPVTAIERHERGFACRIAGRDTAITLDPEQIAPDVIADGRLAKPACLMLRPEHVHLSSRADGAGGLMARVEEIFMKGATTQFRARTASGLAISFEVQGARSDLARIGELVPLEWEAQAPYVTAAEPA
jgi:ABC-type Fe3+/spermidine/putrescine transport system ATPase subunit